MTRSLNWYLSWINRMVAGVSLLSIGLLVMLSGLRWVMTVTLPTWLEVWVFPILTAAAIGYLTNYLAIMMLFRPYRPIPWLFNFQGVIPKKQESLAISLGEEIPRNLLPPEELSRQFNKLVSEYLQNPNLIEDIRKSFCAHIVERQDVLAEMVVPKLSIAIEQAIMPLLSHESLRGFYHEHGETWLKKEINKGTPVDKIVEELQAHTDEFVQLLRDYVQDYLDNRAGILAMLSPLAGSLVDWSKIRHDLDFKLESNECRQLIRRELLQFLGRFGEYVDSDSAKDRLEQIKSDYLESARNMLTDYLMQKVPEFIQGMVASDEFWEFFGREVVPVVKSFIIHRFNHDREQIMEGLELPKCIEKAVMSQNPADIHRLILRVSGEHLIHLQLWGYVLGGLAGLFLVLAQ